MWMNLHTLPAGQSMYTLAVTSDPVGTPEDAVEYDEVDVVAPRGASVAQIVAAADPDGYEHCRVVGVSNQSDGYVLVQDPDGDYR
jgi:hypothetical protein